MPCGYELLFRQAYFVYMHVSGICSYICVRFLQICSFYEPGQCEGLYKWSEQRSMILTLFLCIFGGHPFLHRDYDVSLMPLESHGIVTTISVCRFVHRKSVSFGFCYILSSLPCRYMLQRRMSSFAQICSIG